jgi:NPCBM/NEW2 domain
LWPVVFPGLLAAAEPKPLLFKLHPADGEDAAGSMEKLSDDWSLALGGSSLHSFPGRDIVSLRRQNVLLPPMPHTEHVILANGDRIPGKLLKITQEQAQFQSQLDDTREMTLPLSAVSVIWSSAPEGVDDADLLLRRLATDNRRSDMLWLRNGDRIEGSLLGVDEKEARIRPAAGKEIKLQRDKLAVVAFNTELARAPRARRPYGRLVLADGCRISLAAAHTDGNALAGKTLWGAAVHIPLERLIALSIHRGRAVYLSDLKPRRYEHTPYLDLRWPYRLDASVAGYDLRVAGNTFDKGIGLHAESKLTYEVSAGYQWFEALVGLDDRTGREGSAVIEVLVDGKARDVGAARELSGRGDPKSIRVNVAGAQELTLEVKFGRRGDVQDHVDWVDARLIK